MTNSVSPRAGEPRKPLFAAPQVSVPSAAALAKMRWAKTAGGSGNRSRRGFGFPLPVSLAGRIERLAPADDGLRRFLDELGRAVRATKDDLGDEEAFAGGLPLEPATTRRISEPHVQALLADFQHRQRQANLLVTACVGSCFALTVLGIAMVASFAGRDAGGAAGKHATSIAWHEPRAEAKGSKFVLEAATPDRSLKAEALPVSAGRSDIAPSRLAAQPELIMMQEGRELSLAPLLLQRQAPYLLVRGLPETATLSAGQRNPSGAWLIKNEDIGQLTLTVAGSSGGDYPLEIYALGDGALAQARQRLVIRVEPGLTKLGADQPNWPDATGKPTGSLRTLASLGG